MISHLTSEQLERALAGKPSPETSAHLRRCAQCTEDLAASRNLFAGLQQSASDIAENARQAAPVVQLASLHTSRAPRVAWGLAAAALFLGVLSPAVLHRPAQPPVGPAPQTTSQSTPSISDDALLSGVQDDLTASVPASLLPLAGTSSTSSDPSSSSQRKN